MAFPPAVAAVARLGALVAEAIGSSKVHVSFSSSAISEAQYDYEDGELEVHFTDGRYYTYSGVPEDEFEAFATAGSPGGYFNANIRNSY